MTREMLHVYDQVLFVVVDGCRSTIVLFFCRLLVAILMDITPMLALCLRLSIPSSRSLSLSLWCPYILLHSVTFSMPFSW